MAPQRNVINLTRANSSGSNSNRRRPNKRPIEVVDLLSSNSSNYRAPSNRGDLAGPSKRRKVTIPRKRPNTGIVPVFATSNGHATRQRTRSGTTTSSSNATSSSKTSSSSSSSSRSKTSSSSSSVTTRSGSTTKSNASSGPRRSPFLNRPAELPSFRRTNYQNTPNGIRTRYGGFTLKPHQITVCRLFAKPSTPGLLLYYKVGSGKTLASIAAAEHAMRREGRARPVVVVVPASLRANYLKEIEAAGVDSSRYRVLSYDAVHNLPEHAQRRLGEGAIVVVDEVQNMRNPSSKKYDSLLNVARAAHKRLLLSGTPIMNYPEDIGTVLGLIDPENNVALAVKKQVPLTRFGREVRNQNGNPQMVWQLVFRKTFGRDATKSQQLLESMMRCTTLFYEPDAATVRADYPTKTEHWVPVPMTTEQAMMQFRIGMESPIDVDLERLVQGSTSPAFLTKPREVNNRLENFHPKIDLAVQRVEAEYRRGGKCLVFSTYLKSGLHRIAELLRRRGVRAEVYEGATKPADKKRLVEEYNADALRVLLISDAGKEGLDLKNTTQIHVMEPQWNEDKVAQIIGRGVRYKSHTRAPRHVDVFRYYATLSPQDLRRGAQFGDGVLFKYAADDILMQITQRKQAVNQAFLQRLVRISDDNVRECLP